jgi:hypothetical protein
MRDNIFLVNHLELIITARIRADVPGRHTEEIAGETLKGIGTLVSYKRALPL